MSTCTASIQCHVATVRVHPQGGSWAMQAAYDWACTVVWVSSDTVELVGVDRPLSREQWAAIAAALHDQGVRWVVQRRRDGRVKSIDVSRYAARATGGPLRSAGE